MVGVSFGLADDLDAAPLLFGEAQGRIVVSCAQDDSEAVVTLAAEMDVPAAVIGSVGAPDGRFVVRTARGAAIDLPVASLHEVWSMAIPKLMERTSAE
jgi:phosphoribosylformylglycinamidine synthase subunit PurL